MMKNNLALLASGLICAILAWLFFNYFQSHAFTILIVIFFVSFAANAFKKNIRNKNR